MQHNNTTAVPSSSLTGEVAPSLVPKVPVPQLLQLLLDVSPDALLHVPAGQNSHTEAPEEHTANRSRPAKATLARRARNMYYT